MSLQENNSAPWGCSHQNIVVSREWELPAGSPVNSELAEVLLWSGDVGSTTQVCRLY